MAKPRDADQKRPTYQDVLDEALQETFPASDPISPGAATHTERRISTGKNPTDWQLQPGSATSDNPGALRGAAGGPETSKNVVDGDASLDAVYRELKRGVGHELVSDANVEALIQIALERGDRQIEALLRDWRSPYGEEAER